MRYTNYLLLATVLFTFNRSIAQDDKESNFTLIGTGGIGYGIVENDDQPNYNLNSNSGDILLNYNFNKKFGIATGLGVSELTGNGFNAIGNFYHERTFLKVPLLFTINSNVSESFKVFANIGLYGQTIIKDEYRFLNNTQKDIYEGWNVGAQFGLGFLYNMFDNWSAGLTFNGQSDFSKFESNSASGIDDKQKMKNLNSFGIIFMIDL